MTQRVLRGSINKMSRIIKIRIDAKTLFFVEKIGNKKVNSQDRWASKRVPTIINGTGLLRGCTTVGHITPFGHGL